MKQAQVLTQLVGWSVCSRPFAVIPPGSCKRHCYENRAKV